MNSMFFLTSPRGSNRAWIGAAALSFIVIGAPNLASQDVLESSREPFLRDVESVSVYILGTDALDNPVRDISAAALEAGMEIEFRRAGLRVVHPDDREDSSVLLMITTACLDGRTACAITADLTRFSYIGR